MEVGRLSIMDDDLFTYEVEVASIPCNSKKNDDSKDDDDDMGYDQSDAAFIEWLRLKFFNYKTMDHYTMKALWIYWVRGYDEVELTDEESSDDKDEVAETYLLRALRDSRLTKITRMIGSMNGTRTYHRLMRSHGLTSEFRPNPYQLNILASLLTIKLDVRNGQHVVGRMMDTVMEETYPELTLLETNSIIRITSDDDDESHYKQERRWNIYTNYDDAYEINHEDNEKEELCEVYELLVRNIRRYMIIKYSFNNDEKYVAVKEDEYDDPTITREEACRAS
ncbi:hypothetical protein Tco_0028286 [Tanacetum coccineum]